VKVTRQTRGTKAAAGCLLLLVFGSPLVSACTYAYDPKEMGRNFSVQPGMEIGSVQSASSWLNGQLRTDHALALNDKDQVHPVFGPSKAARLTGQPTASEESVESQEASQSGAFEFRAVSAGPYLLRVEAPGDAAIRRLGFDGYVPIEIDPSAKASTLDLFLFPGVCISLAHRTGEKPAVQ
jgi:hypothetical protein